jgi:phosphoserine aminotransferase
MSEQVLKEAQDEMLSYRGSGMSFMEMSHRDADGPVQSTITSATQVRRLTD